MPIPPIRGYPKSATFQGPFPSRDLLVLLGVTHLDPAIRNMIANFMGWDAAERETVRAAHCSFTPLTDDLPHVLKERLPQCVAWSEYALAGVDETCDTLRVRFHLSPAEELQPATETELRCYCLVVGREDHGDNVRWIVDMGSAAPVKVTNLDRDSGRA